MFAYLIHKMLTAEGIKFGLLGDENGERGDYEANKQTEIMPAGAIFFGEIVLSFVIC